MAARALPLNRETFLDCRGKKEKKKKKDRETWQPLVDSRPVHRTDVLLTSWYHWLFEWREINQVEEKRRSDVLDLICSSPNRPREVKTLESDPRQENDDYRRDASTAVSLWDSISRSSYILGSFFIARNKSPIYSTQQVNRSSAQRESDDIDSALFSFPTGWICLFIMQRLTLISKEGWKNVEGIDRRQSSWWAVSMAFATNGVKVNTNARRKKKVYVFMFYQQKKRFWGERRFRLQGGERKDIFLDHLWSSNKLHTHTVEGSVKIKEEEESREFKTLVCVSIPLLKGGNGRVLGSPVINGRRKK